MLVAKRDCPSVLRGTRKAGCRKFLTSEDYNSITHKSREHYAIIAAVAQKPRKPKIKD